MFGAVCQGEEFEQGGSVADLRVVERGRYLRQGSGKGSCQNQVVPPLSRVHEQPITVARKFPNHSVVRGLACPPVGIWEERAGRNEALFREVNENIAELEARLPGVAETMPVICECARPNCTTPVEISLDEYTSVRRHPNRFIVAPGHDEPSVEHVVEEQKGYLVVEKEGAAAAAADAVP